MWWFTHNHHCFVCSALQGLLKKLGAGFEDILPGMSGVSSSRIKVRSSTVCLAHPAAAYSLHTFHEGCLEIAFARACHVMGTSLSIWAAGSVKPTV
jgi:hypothetical protein